MLEFLKRRPPTPAQPIVFTDEAAALLTGIAERTMGPEDLSVAEPLDTHNLTGNSSDGVFADPGLARILKRLSNDPTRDLRNRVVTDEPLRLPSSGTTETSSLKDIQRLQMNAGNIYERVKTAIERAKMLPNGEGAKYTLMSSTSSDERFSVTYDRDINHVIITSTTTNGSNTRTLKADIRVPMFGSKHHFKIEDATVDASGQRLTRTEHDSSAFGKIHDDTADALNTLEARVNEHLPSLLENAPKQRVA